jgi:hypothetical protein
MSNKEDTGQTADSKSGENKRTEFSEATRSMSGATSEPFPLQHGDPRPGGVRPGPDTGHTPQSAAPTDAPEPSPSADTSAASDS